MLIGYARVSTKKQDLETQIQALKDAGCKTIFSEIITGSGKRPRQQFNKMMDILKPGDTVVVSKLDRLGRSITELTAVLKAFQDRHIEFKSITQEFDIKTPMGRFFFIILSAVADLELSFIQERTAARLDHLREKGQKLGKKPTERGKRAVQLIKEGKTFHQVHVETTISQAQYYRLKASLN